MRESNKKLISQIQQFESNIQLGKHQEFFLELEKKGQMLEQLNRKLENDNQILAQQLGGKDQLIQLQNQKNQSFKKVKDLREELGRWKQRLNELDEQDNNNKIKELIGELESKVSGLIDENEQLNSMLREQDGIQKQQQKLEQLQNEEKKLKQKIEQSNEGQNRIADLEGKMRQMISQNERLRETLECEINESEIQELQEKLVLIERDNRKLEHKIQEYRYRCNKY